MNWQIIIASDLFSNYLKITDLLNFLFLIFYKACCKFSELN